MKHLLVIGSILMFVALSVICIHEGYRIKALETKLSAIAPDDCTIQPAKRNCGDGFLTLNSAKGWTARMQVNSKTESLEFYREDGMEKQYVMAIPMTKTTGGK